MAALVLAYLHSLTDKTDNINIQYGRSIDVQEVWNMASALENLETQLELFIENVRQIRIIVSDFQPQGQNVLNQKMWVICI